MVDGRTVAVLMCYLLHDVFKQLFPVADWYAKVAPARAQQAADWYRTPEGKRCTAALVALGYDLAEVRFVALHEDAAHMVVLHRIRQCTDTCLSSYSLIEPQARTWLCMLGSVEVRASLIIHAM